MDAPTPITPAGWYDDGHGQLRWWDGSQWTAHTAPLAQQTVQQPTAPRPAAAAGGPLVEVKKSKLGWILAIVLVLAAVIGALIGGAAGAALGGDTAPLKRTYAQYLLAERNQDCEALEQVTGQSFRDELFDYMSCEEWAASSPPTLRVGKPVWTARFGPVGFLFAEERFPGDSGSSGTIMGYVLVKSDGQWRLESADD